jgi:hypothetical protein
LPLFFTPTILDNQSGQRPHGNEIGQMYRPGKRKKKEKKKKKKEEKEKAEEKKERRGGRRRRKTTKLFNGRLVASVLQRLFFVGTQMIAN